MTSCFRSWSRRSPASRWRSGSSPGKGLLGGRGCVRGLGQARLVPGGGSLVEHALGRGLVVGARGLAGGRARGLGVAARGGGGDLLARGLERRLDSLVALARLLVLFVALDL